MAIKISYHLSWSEGEKMSYKYKEFSLNSLAKMQSVLQLCNSWLIAKNVLLI